ncbi:ExbD/TolR family protein [Luteimonas abyssi]|uniref:ExbD/TolR family protein n=1 Tax=Luteimonas abyssi TaxID=1247514 RepID=UPI000737D73C|nr:biopolymer transporter ExbD [Luteimonas abyssi]
MAFSSNDGGGKPMAAINVVPLVDVMLVLLIIFMVTAPLMTHRVQVELPEATLDEVPEGGAAPPITIAVTEQGNVYVNDEQVSLAQLESVLSVEAQKTPQPPINIRGDRATRYRAIDEVVTIAQAQGMRKVGFVSTAEPN